MAGDAGRAANAGRHVLGDDELVQPGMGNASPLIQKKPKVKRLRKANRITPNMACAALIPFKAISWQRNSGLQSPERETEAVH